jgi:Transglutaminase-like superfamily
MPFSELRLVAEAALGLAVARLALISIPFRCIVPWLTRQPRHQKPGANALMNIQVRRAVIIAARYAPWRAVCLPQAMAAKWMLARRGYSSTLYLGVSKNRAAFIAHAWLDTGGMTVVGGANKADFTPVGRFE